MLMTSRRQKRQFVGLQERLYEQRTREAPTPWARDRGFGLKISDYWNPRDDVDPFEDHASYIAATISALEAIEPDISDEQLYARTMDICQCSMDDITEALLGED